jgi:hypothetical protein
MKIEISFVEANWGGFLRGVEDRVPGYYMHGQPRGDGECGVLVTGLNRVIALTLRRSGAVFVCSTY